MLSVSGIIVGIIIILVAITAITFIGLILYKKSKALSLIIVFVLSYLFVCVIKNIVWSNVSWAAGTTKLDMLSWYFIKSFEWNIIPTLVVTIIVYCIVVFLGRNKK